MKDPNLLHLVVFHIDGICVENETNDKKYHGGNIWNSDKKMYIVKGCITKRYATQKASWNTIDASVHSESGKYVSVTVKQSDTMVWIHPYIAFESWRISEKCLLRI